MGLIEQCLSIVYDNSDMMKPTVTAAREELDQLRHDATVLAAVRQIIVSDPINHWTTSIALSIAEAQVNGIEQALET